MNCHIENIQRHRNGITGAPFWAVTLKDPDHGRMLGIVFEEQGHVAVFNIDKLAQGDIAFGSNSWRGDHYEPQLRRSIVRWEEMEGFDTNEDSPVEQQEANAQLAAAAPELWDALNECIRLLADFEDTDGEEGDAYRQGLAALSLCLQPNQSKGE